MTDHQKAESLVERLRKLAREYRPSVPPEVSVLILADCAAAMIEAADRLTLLEGGGRDKDSSIADSALAVRAASTEAEPSGPVNCTHVLRRQGVPYPRTCERCRLGPCPFYNNDGSAKR